MKNVVMGGGGFIGSHITESLLRDGEEVIVFDRPGALYLNELSRMGASILLGNYLDNYDLQKAISQAENVFHLISTTVPKSSNDDPVFDIQSNLIGTLNLFTIAKTYGVKKIIFASSGGTVYGIPKEIPIPEEHPTNPICSHGIIKLAIEKYAHLFWTLYGLDYSILRISNAYGERQPMNKVQGIIPMIVGNGLQNREIQIWGDGTVVRDYVHVSDIAGAFIKACRTTFGTKVFNIGSGIGVSINELIRLIESQLGEPLGVSYQHSEPYDVPINILNISHARSILDWRPKVELSEGISRTINYIKSCIQYY